MNDLERRTAIGELVQAIEHLAARKPWLAIQDIDGAIEQFSDERINKMPHMKTCDVCGFSVSIN